MECLLTANSGHWRRCSGSRQFNLCTIPTFLVLWVLAHRVTVGTLSIPEGIVAILARAVSDRSSPATNSKDRDGASTDYAQYCRGARECPGAASLPP